MHGCLFNVLIHIVGIWRIIIFHLFLTILFELAKMQSKHVDGVGNESER